MFYVLCSMLGRCNLREWYTLNWYGMCTYKGFNFVYGQKVDLLLLRIIQFIKQFEMISVFLRKQEAKIHN